MERGEGEKGKKIESGVDKERMADGR